MKSREQILAEIAEVVGMTSVKVYIHLVEHYIAVYEKGRPEGDVWVKPDIIFLCKELGLKPKEFRKIIINLVDKGFVQKNKIDGRLWWRPSFQGLDGIV